MIEVECRISESGHKFWHIKGTNVYHREDGPAIEYNDGEKWWYQHNKIHRLDGPAYENFSYAQWWVNGKRINVYNQKDFERYIKLMAFE